MHRKSDQFIGHPSEDPNEHLGRFMSDEYTLNSFYPYVLLIFLVVLSYK